MWDHVRHSLLLAWLLAMPVYLALEPPRNHWSGDIHWAQMAVMIFCWWSVTGVVLSNVGKDRRKRR